MTEQEEKEVGKLNQGRLLRDASAELLPLLLKQKETAIAGLINAYRAGETSHLIGFAAELSVISDLTGKITRNNKETAAREGKLYEQQRPD